MLTAIGLMTGSSMDGIDAAIIITDGMDSVEHSIGITTVYSSSFRLLLRIAEYAIQQENGNLRTADHHFPDYIKQYTKKHNINNIQPLREELGDEITMTNIVNKLTMLHAELVKSLIERAGHPHIDVIGFHGQNLYHNPTQHISIQVGDGQLLADLTNICVIHDFRSQDVKHGGQGAPLAPLYHRVLVRKDMPHPVAIVNCGGIANITIIPSSKAEDLIGFDIGPGNALIDRYVRHRTDNHEFMDEDGKYGQAGQVHYDILSLLKKGSIINYDNNFLLELPPKSLDARNFQLIPELNSISLEDGCATLEAFTVECIVDSLDLLAIESPKTWILAGGGWKNPMITMVLKQRLFSKLGQDIKIMTSDEAGCEPQYLEAEIFAYLAVRSLKHLPISLPNITGVSEPMLGGKKYIPQAL